MKKVVWTLAMLALMSGATYAQDKAALEKALIVYEHKINEAVAKSDKAAFTDLITPDTMSADGHGFMKASEFAAVLDQVKVKTWTLSEEKVWWVDPGTAIVTSTWTGSGTFQGQPFPSKTYCSTVWTKKGDRWVAVFHQESEAVKPAPPKPPVKK